MLRISDKSKYFTCNGLRWRIKSEDKSQSIPVSAPKIKRVAEAGDERNLMRQEMLKSGRIPSSSSPSLHFPPSTCHVRPHASSFYEVPSPVTSANGMQGMVLAERRVRGLMCVSWLWLMPQKAVMGDIAFIFLVLLLEERMLARGGHVCVCREACHKAVKGQESFVEIIDTWGQRNIGMSLAGVTTESFCSTKEPAEGAQNNSSSLCEPCIS